MRAILSISCPLILTLTAFAQQLERRDDFLEQEFESYRLKATDGPWLVYAASFVGDKSRQYAHDVANELRRKHKYDAFIYDRFQVEKQARDKQLAEWHRQYGEEAKVGKYRIPEEYAVVVGNFKNIDEAKTAANKIKTLSNPQGVPVSRAVIARAKTQWSGNTMTQTRVGETQKDEVKLFHGAFPAPNPMRPKDLAKAKPDMPKLDSSFLELNRGEPHSLLKCQQPYTLTVKVFQAATIFQEAPKPSIFAGNRTKIGGTAGATTGPKIEIQTAAKEATRLANLLRDGGRGYEAYVFHTNDSSTVTIGGFKSKTDAELVKLQKQLAGKTLGEFTLMPAPQAMEVPRP